MPIAAVAEATPVECDLHAYLVNDGPAGTIVRSGPSGRATVIVRAPGDHDAIAIITAFQGGWFRVGRLEQVGTDDDRTLIEDGQGWIHRSRLRVDVTAADPILRQQPRSDSKIVKRLQAEQEGVVLLGCAGKWAQVGVGTESGWLSPAGQCANPLTTCP